MIKKSIILFSLLLFSSCGPVGPKGVEGVPGPKGSPGPTGEPGTSCTTSVVKANSTAPSGGMLISCPDHTSALVLNGSDGVNGINGTVVQTVQFCPNVVSSYPTTFPEIGFCIDNDIYAVYSANSGFLTKITQGVWQSNAIGSSCTFTVGPNCQIGH